MDLINTDGTIEQIILSKPLNALLISDQHFSDSNQSYFSIESIAPTMACLQRLITKVKPDQILILGDLFHYGQQNNQFVFQIMSFFSELDKEIFMIGGNHDKELIENQIKDWSKNNFHIYSDSFLLYEANQEKVWFTHDGNNPYWLDKSEVPDFIISLKKIYKFSVQHWLITGHIHLPCIIKESKVASLGCFNVEGHNQSLSYGIIKEIANKITFSLHDAENCIYQK
ncbi:MAG: metallophosphoesterase [Promethearchaeota archaeon]